MRVIEQDRFAVDLSRADTGDTVLRLGDQRRSEIGQEINLNAAEARVLAYSLLAAAARQAMDSSSGDPAEWPESYWPEGPAPFDRD